MNARLPQRVAGFTLLDAMIAVVILTTGILALTLLQLTMLRSAADARERSVAMTLAQNVLEQQKAAGLQTIAGYGSLVAQGAFSGGNCDYANAARLDDPAATGDSRLMTEFRYCTSVKRYQASGNSFVEVPVSGSTAPVYGGFVPEYKQLTVDIGWRKSDNSWGSLRLGDAISGIPLSNSNELANRSLSAVAAQVPAQVNYDLGNLTQNTNFIPIAVGDGSGNNVAATNPTPKLIGGGVAETSFQVYTYAANNNVANVQKEIDTKVIGCRCSSRLAPSLQPADQTTSSEGFLTRPLRPTYWDGTRYTEPAQANYVTTDLIGQPLAAAAGQQSPYCDICCRDHHDPSSVNYAGASSDESDDLPRFDPYRTNHVHYQDPSGDLDANRVTAAGQTYQEVCRVIRVNGVYRVSQDPLIDHFAFIPTDNSAVNYSTTSAADNYKNFVTSYIHDRFVPLAGYTWSNNRVVVDSLEQTNHLNDQAASALLIGSNDRRYLQNRGLLLDLLSYEAKSAMQNCIDQSGTNAPSDTACALRHASFASVNLTELSKWDVVPGTGVPTVPVTVTYKNFSVTTPTGAPVAGQVRDASGAIPNSLAEVWGQISRSLTTLADLTREVFYKAPNDSFWSASDHQPFQYTGAQRPSVKITINVTGLTYFTASSGSSAAPYVGWYNPTANTQGDCIRTASSTRFVCDLVDATNATDVHIRLFNYYQQLTPKNNDITCGSGNTKKTADRPRCNLFRPATFTGSTTVVFTSPTWRTSSSTGKPKDDETAATLGAVVDGGSYTVNFEENSANPLQATYQCDSITNQPVLSFNDGECRR